MPYAVYSIYTIWSRHDGNFTSKTHTTPFTGRNGTNLDLTWHDYIPCYPPWGLGWAWLGKLSLISKFSIEKSC